MIGPFDASTVVFAILAIFVVWKLRSVLGTRTGNERPPYDPFAARRKAGGPNGTTPAETGKVIRLPGVGEERVRDQPTAAETPETFDKVVAPGASSAVEGLRQIRAADPGFSAQAFLGGARAAYELIIAAFAKGDREALRPLLAKDVFDGFDGSIAARESKGWKAETTLVSLGDVLIEDASLRGRTAQVVVRFQPQMITVTKDADGAVVDGSADQVADAVDLWTFAREVDSRDPNWRLVATENPA